MSDALQVQLVRLRFENIPFRVLSRSEFDAWPFAEDSIVIFARTTCSVDNRMPKGVAIASTSPLYMLSDGIERTLSNAMEFSQFHTAAMATRGIWMSSGWNG